MRERMELSGLWRFQPDLNDEGEGLKYPAEGCDVRRWREIDVPGPRPPGYEPDEPRKS
jgi:hypothetical protein